MILFNYSKINKSPEQNEHGTVRVRPQGKIHTCSYDSVIPAKAGIQTAWVADWGE